MSGRDVKERLESLTRDLAALRARLEVELEERAPISEVERLDLAFDRIAQAAPASEVARLDAAFDAIAERAPGSEVARLDEAFTHLGRVESDLAELRDHVGTRLATLEQRIAELEARPGAEPVPAPTGDFAPASEVARLDLAFEELAARAPSSEIERLNEAFERISGLRELVEDGVRSERAVEIPWVVATYAGEADVLEVGISNAEQRYLDALRDLAIPNLCGLDLAPAPERAVAIADVTQGDVRDASTFPENSFDLIVCVSTLEHIGRDNRVYGLDDTSADAGGDVQALSAMARWLRPGGRLLLSVPFGRFEDQGWLVNYDAATIADVIGGAGLAVASEEYHELRGAWQERRADQVAHRGYRSLGAPHAGAVALFELVHG